jgi:gamma-glutamyltranspeptidase/glutathione hydrolase
MVASSQPLATQIGLDILKRRYCCRCSNRSKCGLRFDGTVELVELFAIVWDAKTEKLYGLNASGRSKRCPILRKIILQKFQQLDLFLSLYPVVLMAGLSCTVNSGLTMDEILSPTIAYAEEVFQFRNWLLITGRFRISIYEAVSKR